MERITQLFVLSCLTLSIALALECPNCHYFNPSVSGSDEVKTELTKLLGKNGDELCPAGEDVAANCTTEGFCASFMYTRDISFDIPNVGSGVYTFSISMRGCGDGTLDECNDNVDPSSQFNATYQYFLTTFENVTLTEANLDWECCQDDMCRSSQTTTPADMDGTSPDDMDGTSQDDMDSTTAGASERRECKLLIVMGVAMVMYLYG